MITTLVIGIVIGIIITHLVYITLYIYQLIVLDNKEPSYELKHRPPL